MQDLDLGKNSAMPVRQRVVHGSIPKLLAVCGFLSHRQLNQTLRIMKCTIICLLVFCLQSSAGVFSQNITFSGKNVPLQKVFIAIEKQTHYVFFYNDEILRDAHLVTLNVKSASINTVMQECLKGQPLEFSIEDKTIFITKKVVASPIVYVEEVKPPIDVSGRVTDDQGNPLVGASVKVRGTNKGANTDKDGRFVLNDVEENAVLEISFVGHEMQSVSVRGQRMLSISLTQKLSMLDETVVIAYGTTTKRLNTGNVATVKASDIEKQPVNNPLLALQGRVPGLFITQANGLPGSGVTVRIQGQNSIANGKDPLYVIDGVPFLSQLLPGIGNILGVGSNINGVTSYGNPFSYINPSDIESIEILKDADATAIYGSRAANGAILITTKKGKIGKTMFNLNVQNGWGNLTRKLKLLDTEQYLQIRREALNNEGKMPTIANGDYDLLLWDTTKYTDWQDELIGKTAKYTNIAASITGGTNIIQYTVGYTYYRETPVFPGRFADEKQSLHFHINNNTPNNKFKFQLSGNYLVGNNQLPTNDLTPFAIILAPNAPQLYNDDGSLNWAPNASGNTTWGLSGHPLANLFTKYKNKTNNTIGNATISYNIYKQLVAKCNFGYNYLNGNETVTIPLVATAPENRPTTLRQANFTFSTFQSWIFEPQLSYIQPIGKGILEAFVGSTSQENRSNVQAVNGNGYNSDDVLDNIISASTITKGNSSLNSIYKYNALYGRINYNLQEKYILNIVGRRDGTSRFGAENRYHNFGSIAGAWIFSKLSFIQKRMPFLSFGKVKGSYGTTGNDQIGDYRFLSLFTALNTEVAYQNMVSLTPQSLQNRNLQWEETKKLQYGIELGFFNNKIFITANYYKNRSSNQLVSYALPIITGFNSISKNLPAIVQNTGWEISLEINSIKTNSFTWTSNFNITLPQNKLINFPNLNSSTYANQFVIGKSITTSKVYHFLGVNPETGIYQFENINGDITSSPSNSTDRFILIDLSPKFYGGFLNNFKYKGFELDILFQFTKQYGMSYFFGNRPGYSNSNQPIHILNRWQKAGDIASIQKYSPSNNLISQLTFANNSDKAYGDASYIRLKNISLSKQLPTKWISKKYLSNCKLYIQGQNILTITNYVGLDPETKSSTTLPPLRLMTVGILIGF